MSHELAICLIAVVINLVGMLVFYSAASHFLARFAWRGHGIVAAIVLIIATQLFWMPAAFLSADNGEALRTAAYALWFGNWLVTGFALVVLCRRTGAIPKSLEDAARLDGLGASGTWRRAIFPFVRRDLALLALFTVMATLLPYWAFINLSQPDSIIFQRSSTFAGHLSMMTAGSLVGTIPLIGIFFAAKKRDN